MESNLGTIAYRKWGEDNSGSEIKEMDKEVDWDVVEMAYADVWTQNEKNYNLKIMSIILDCLRLEFEFSTYKWGPSNELTGVITFPKGVITFPNLYLYLARHCSKYLHYYFWISISSCIKWHQ